MPSWDVSAEAQCLCGQEHLQVQLLDAEGGEFVLSKHSRGSSPPGGGPTGVT